MCGYKASAHRRIGKTISHCNPVQNAAWTAMTMMQLGFAAWCAKESYQKRWYFVWHYADTVGVSSLSIGVEIFVAIFVHLLQTVAIAMWSRSSTRNSYVAKTSSIDNDMLLQWSVLCTSARTSTESACVDRFRTIFVIWGGQSGHTSSAPKHMAHSASQPCHNKPWQLHDWVDFSTWATQNQSGAWHLEEHSTQAGFKNMWLPN